MAFFGTDPKSKNTSVFSAKNWTKPFFCGRSAEQKIDLPETESTQLPVDLSCQIGRMPKIALSHL